MKNKIIWLIAAIVFSASAPVFSQGWARPLIKVAQNAAKVAVTKGSTYFKNTPPVQPRLLSNTFGQVKPTFTPGVGSAVWKTVPTTGASPASQKILATPKYRVAVPPVVVPAKKQWRADPDAVKLGTRAVKEVAKARIKEKEEEKKKQYKG
jgi:hypothetical protein